jgi:hypothetical protein
MSLAAWAIVNAFKPPSIIAGDVRHIGADATLSAA